MASLSSFLWLLSLMAYFCSSQTVRINIKMKSTHIQISQNVELECDSSSSELGIHWIHQDMAYTLQSIVYINTRGKIIPETLVGFIAMKSSTSYKLTVKDFKEKNQGIYYCAAYQGQTLIFSKGHQVYLPVTTTTPATTTRRTTTLPQATSKEPMGRDPSSSEKELSDSSLKFSCAPYILIPLAGGCFLLLIILVITLSICCDPRRRRRTCRCHRAMNGTNGKHSLPH
ncbi:T-cell surface glycoprotein CD8 alpha chain [Tiliqua scincoides]|uniref:T-cell surface glycoprotein CD8 alpha chain n=1 Tax=Tiliqua scincoides TaxID=71010 RepID=UPI0034631204